MMHRLLSDPMVDGVAGDVRHRSGARVWADLPDRSRRYEGYDPLAHTPPTPEPTDGYVLIDSTGTSTAGVDIDGFRRDVRSVARHGLDLRTFRREWLALVDVWFADDAIGD